MTGRTLLSTSTHKSWQRKQQQRRGPSMVATSIGVWSHFKFRGGKSFFPINPLNSLYYSALYGCHLNAKIYMHQYFKCL